MSTTTTKPKKTKKKEQSLETWGDIYKYTWEHCWKRQSSKQDTLHRIEKVTSFWGDSFPLSQLAKGHVWVELQKDLLEDYNLSNSRVNKIVSVASHAMRYTHRLDLHKYKRPYYELLDADECRQSWFTKEQVAQLCLIAVEIYRNQHLADAMNVSAYTGIRQGELLKLRVADVDLENNVIWIGGRPETKPKGKKSRPVPIAHKIKFIFEKRCKTNKKLVFGDDFSNKDQLFKQFLKCRKQLGLDSSYVWHSFRHSFCTWSGAVDHPKNIQAIAGHKSIDTTMKYCKAFSEALHGCVAKL